MYKMKVAVLFGGCSGGYNVPTKSEMELVTNIGTEVYQYSYVVITKF